MRKTVALLLTGVLLAAPAIAAPSGDPEIQDEQGDVDVQHLVEADLLQQVEVDQEEAETIGDVLETWVHTETEDSFSITTQLAEIPNQTDSETTLTETWLHFTVRDGEYHAVAELGASQAGGEIQADFALYLEDTKVADLAGNVDPDQDRVTWKIAKADVRDPTEGDALTDFHVTTHLPTGHALDYAPGVNAQNLPSTDDPTATDPTALKLAPTPTYGDDYAFQSFETVEADLTVEATPASAQVTAGERAQFMIRVNNDAAEADEASLTVDNAPDSWSVNVDPVSLSLDAGESKTATLTVRPSDSASGQHILSVGVTSTLGADRGADLAITVEQPEADDTGGSTDDGSTGDASTSNEGSSTDSTDDSSADQPAQQQADNETSDEQNGAPFPGVGLVLLAIGLVAAVEASRTRR